MFNKLLSASLTAICPNFLLTSGPNFTFSIQLALRLSPGLISVYDNFSTECLKGASHKIQQGSNMESMVWSSSKEVSRGPFLNFFLFKSLLVITHHYSAIYIYRKKPAIFIKNWPVAVKQFQHYRGGWRVLPWVLIHQQNIRPETSGKTKYPVTKRP